MIIADFEQNQYTDFNCYKYINYSEFISKYNDVYCTIIILVKFFSFFRHTINFSLLL